MIETACPSRHARRGALPASRSHRRRARQGRGRSSARQRRPTSQLSLQCRAQGTHGLLWIRGTHCSRERDEMTLASSFQHSVNDVLKPTLTQAGFTGRALTFRRVASDVVHVVEVQKSRSSGPDEVAFAVNLGVSSFLLQQLGPILHLSRAVKPSSVSVVDCQWWVRLTLGLDPGSGQWWRCQDQSSCGLAVAGAAEALRVRGFAILDSFGSDEGLCAHWAKTRWSAGTFVWPIYFAELAIKLGPPERAESAIAQLRAMRENGVSSNIDRYLRLIGRE